MTLVANQVEPFIADFTGKLITFHTKEGKKIGLKRAVPVVRGRGYMLTYDAETGGGLVLPVVIP